MIAVQRKAQEFVVSAEELIPYLLFFCFSSPSSVVWVVSFLVLVSAVSAVS